MKLYVNNGQIIAGMTVKDTTQEEKNNMALHVCENDQHILQNRKSFAARIGYSINDLVCAFQTHSANFYKVTPKDCGRGALTMETAIPNTDALYTYEANIVLTSFSADCVPILLYNEQTNVIAAIHSGWQGTVKEVLPTLLHQLIHVEQNPAHTFHVYINPALSQQKFEVDRDVYEKFKVLGYADDFMYFHVKTGKYHIDNQLTIQKQCELVGIPTTQIHLDSTCTYMSDDGFSYRQDKKTGRHMSFIVRKAD